MTEPVVNERCLGGKYLLLEPIGSGGMGSVWRAEHLSLHSHVAVKLIEPRVALIPESTARFVREARAAAALRSPHVVQILDYGIDTGKPYIVMELLEGESLERRLERVGRLDPAETSRILTQVARAVARAHETDVIHRDLKPGNIFLVRNDDEELAKVLDFGLAKAPAASFETSGIGTRTGAFMGTPSYMSPEQAEGSHDVDWRSDLWSLGVIAFECLAGKRPFVSEGFGGLVLKICSRPLPVPSAIASVPPGFDVWFARSCARNPDERFASAKEQAAELRRVCEGSQTNAVQRFGAALGGSPSFVGTAEPLPETLTRPFWEKKPSPPEAPQRQAPQRQARQRRRWGPVVLVLLLSCAVVSAIVFSQMARTPSADVAQAIETGMAASPGVPADPPRAAPPDPRASSAPTASVAPSAAPVPVAPEALTGAAADRPPTRSAPVRATKRPTNPSAPASAPALAPSRTIPKRVNLGI